MKRLCVFTLLLVLLCVVTGGCRQSQLVSVGQNVGTRFACDQDTITAECIVTRYADDGGEYLSEQVHRICSDDGAIEMSANEPQGRFVWLLRGREFKVVVGKGRLSRLETTLCDRGYARIISVAMLAGAGMMDVSSLPVLDPVKIEGQWYEPISLPSQSEEVTVTLYRSKDTGIIDVIGLEDLAGGRTLTARSYNYRFSQQLGKRVPTKIDLFGGSRLSLANRILDINYEKITK